MFKKVAYAAVIGAAIATSQSAFAGTDSGTMNVSAQINASCTITTTDINFGSLTTTNSGNVDLRADASVTCASVSPFNVGISFGNNNGGGGQRRMANTLNATQTMNYDVYISDYGINSYGLVSTYNTSNNYNSPLTFTANTPVVVPIYARLPSQSTPPSGTYTDVLTVTVNY